MVICASAISKGLVAIKRLRLKLHHASAVLVLNDTVSARQRAAPSRLNDATAELKEKLEAAE